MSAFRKNEEFEAQPVRMWVTLAFINEDGEFEIITRDQSDAWPGSKDISCGKALTAWSFSSNQNALTTRALGTLTQPGGPLWNIGSSNPKFSIIEFPGGIPLYRKMCTEWFKVGAIGVSGDSKDNDEAVALAATKEFQAPLFMRSTPYVKQIVETVSQLKEVSATAQQRSSLVQRATNIIQSSSLGSPQNKAAQQVIQVANDPGLTARQASGLSSSLTS